MDDRFARDDRFVRMNRTAYNIAGLLGWVVLASGVVGAAAAITNSAGGSGWRPAWFMFGFELVIALAGVLAVLLSRGRYGSIALGLVCVAGTVVVGSLFGYLGSGGTVWGMGLKPLLAVRAGLGLAIVGLAAGVQLQGRRDGVRLLARGVMFGVGALTIVAVGYVLRNTMASWSEILVVFLLMFAFVAVVGLVAASADYLIRAFAPGDGAKLGA